MPLYLVDRDLPGFGLLQIRAAQRRLLEAGERLDDGLSVRYLRSTFVPSQGHLMDLFEAPDAGRVLELNAMARFPLLRVIEVVDVTPQAEPDPGR